MESSDPGIHTRDSTCADALPYARDAVKHARELVRREPSEGQWLRTAQGNLEDVQKGCVGSMAKRKTSRKSSGGSSSRREGTPKTLLQVHVDQEGEVRLQLQRGHPLQEAEGHATAVLARLLRRTPAGFSSGFFGLGPLQ